MASENPVPGLIREQGVRALVLNSAQIDLGDKVSKEVELLKPGWILHKDIEGGKFLADEESFDQIIQNFDLRKNDLVFDYEHQTLTTNVAPAAGWIKKIYKKDGSLWASVEWTDRAEGYLANKEYKYCSPVVLVRKSDKRGIYIHSVALTNDPNIDGLKPLANKLNLDEGDDQKMDIEKLRGLLGLEGDATEEQIMEAIEKLVKSQEQQVAVNSSIRKIVGIGEDAKEAELMAELMLLKNNSGLANRVADLEKQAAKKKQEDLLEMALNSGKITKDMIPQAKEMIEASPEAFELFMNKQQSIIPIDKKLDPPEDKNEKKDFTETDMAVNSALGISKEDLEKFGDD